MAMTAQAHKRIKDWLQSQISHGTYRIGNTTNTMPVHEITQVGDVLEVKFYLDNNVAGVINRFQVIDTSGAVWDDQPDSIDKPDINGLLITFKYTVRRV